MAKTLISLRNRGERGVALLEATMALALVSLIAATAYSVFSQAAASSVRAEARLAALAQAETALELASAPAFLVEALDEGAAQMDGGNWRVDAAPYAEDGRSGEDGGPLALIRLQASVGPPDAPILTLETLRVIPR